METVKAIRSGQKIVVTADGKNREEDAAFALVMHDENGNMQEISVPAKGEAVLELIRKVETISVISAALDGRADG